MLLDVRPPPEVEKVGIPGAVAVALFLPDSRMELGSLLANYAAFGTGGWWVGGGHFIPNADFLAQVRRSSGLVGWCLTWLGWCWWCWCWSAQVRRGRVVVVVLAGRCLI